MTPFRKHLETWKGGCGSAQCRRAKNRCFFRGTVPCDVLFIGEAPGESEDVLGSPFAGPAGLYLDKMIEEAMRLADKVSEEADLLGAPDPYTLTWGFTNVVGCIPRDDITGTMKATEPDLEQIEACRPRLAEIVRLCSPRLVVYVGVLSEKHAPMAVNDPNVHTVKIAHPAHILRSVPAERGLKRKRAVVQLAAALEKL